jgi:poly(3-hydroxybutyrate) depolymerase
LHIAFHGCQQNSESIGSAFMEKTGYNAWADTHNIVVLYPQTKSSYLPLNPKACWDWWGYSGAEYASKNGAQIKQIANMVAALRK